LLYEISEDILKRGEDFFIMIAGRHPSGLKFFRYYDQPPFLAAAVC
jgi:hypothetical protein